MKINQLSYSSNLFDIKYSNDLALVSAISLFS